MKKGTARLYVGKSSGQRVVRQGKTIGFFDYNTNTFSKKVKASKHLYRAKDSWGIDGGYFYNVLLPRDAKIEVMDEESRLTYATDAKSMEDTGFNTNYPPYGIQRHLTRSMWKKIT